MAEVPEHQCTGALDDRGDRRHVGERPRSVVDVTQHRQSGLRGQGLGDVIHGHPRAWIGADPSNVQTHLGCDALYDESIGGEVALLDHDLAAVRAGGDRSSDQLVEQHGGRVRHDRLTRRRAERD
jgi:hypothetical protein